MEEKKTEMVLKVDLQCACCYRKVKKILCRYPEIRDQRYDEKANTVSIIVLTCCPEKIRDKLCYRGGKVIKSIDIKEPPKPTKPKEQEKPKVHEKPKDLEKPKEPEKPKVHEKPKDLEKPKELEKSKVHEKPKDLEKPKELEKPKVQEKPKENEKPKQVEKPKDQEKPKEIPNEKPKEAPKPKEQEKPKEHEKPKEQEKPKHAPEKSAEPKAHPPPTAAPPMLQPMPGMVAVHAAQGYPPPVETGYIFMPSYGESYYDGPTYHEYGMPIVAAPALSFDYYAQNYGGYAKPVFVQRDDYFSEENSQGCSIM